MKTQKIYFTIQTEKEFNNEKKEHEIEFMLEFDETGECIDGESFNPTSGWTNFTQWHTGWSEQDPDLETLLQAIEEYSKTMEIVELVALMEQCDINKHYHQVYYCDTIEEEYKFTIICTDLEGCDDNE